jgi:hypothetical protein
VSEAGLPERYRELDRLLQAGDLDAAQAALKALSDAADTNTEHTALLEMFEVQLGVLRKDFAPDMGLTRLLVVMRRVPKLPFAREMYQRISQLAYRGGQSSLSHSHPPPPPSDGDDS